MLMLTDKEAISANFKEYFVHIGPNLAKKSLKLTHYLNGNFPNSMFLLDTNPSEITQIVEVLKNSKSAGYDGVSAA